MTNYNRPGVTVEKKEGEARLGDVQFTVVDLPGIYSLSPYSQEELVARKFIIEERATFHGRWSWARGS